MAKKRKNIPTLKVVFDTNALYTDAAHFLVSKDVSDVIRDNSGHQDVKIIWCLPEVVVLERNYQMQAKACALLPHIERVEKLLGHKLNITEQQLKADVERVIKSQCEALELQRIELDPKKVDWPSMLRHAAFREPPFEAQKEGKGFRDALIVETLLQLIEASPATEAICRIGFVSKDALIVEAATKGTQGKRNVRVLSNLEELKDLINTIVSEIPEDVVATLRKRALKMFWAKDDPTTFYYKEKVRAHILSTYDKVLKTPPAGATKVSLKSTYVSGPTFVKKVGRQVFWSSQISFFLEASKDVVKAAPQVGDEGKDVDFTQLPDPISNIVIEPKRTGGLVPGETAPIEVARYYQRLSNLISRATPATENVSVAESKAIFEVAWSNRLGNGGKLVQPKIAEIKLVTPPWQ